MPEIPAAAIGAAAAGTAAADSTEIHTSVDGVVGLIRINRPDRGNSVTPAVVTALGDAAREMEERDEVRAIVLTGTGAVFCAGADVQEMYEVQQADGPDGLMTYLADVWMPAVQRTVRSLWATTKPIVAAYNGAATAGGLDFGLTCDVRIAADTARFAESYVNLGMVPVAGGAYLLPLTVGRSNAMQMLTSGDLIDADRALAIGLVSEVVPAAEIGERARVLAERLGRAPAATQAAVKTVARPGQTEDLDRALQLSLATNIDLIGRAEVRGRILAVMERYSRRLGAPAPADPAR